MMPKPDTPRIHPTHSMYKVQTVENTAYSISLLPFPSSYALHSRAKNSIISQVFERNPPTASRAPNYMAYSHSPYQVLVAVLILNREIIIGHRIYTGGTLGVSSCSNRHVIIIRSQRRGSSISMHSLADHAASRNLVRT
jgi:hypothetical protein